MRQLERILPVPAGIGFTTANMTLDDKYHCFMYEATAAVAGGDPPSPKGDPHPLLDWEDPLFGWLPFAAGRNSGSS